MSNKQKTKKSGKSLKHVVVMHVGVLTIILIGILMFYLLNKA